MKPIEKITIAHPVGSKTIELFEGDLSQIPPQESVDILVVSAFRDNYDPTPATLIGALAKKGISMKELSKNKGTDLRQFFSCWLSQPIEGQSFRQILCFEPAESADPAELVGDIFQSLMPFLFGNPPIRSIAMSLVTTGRQGFKAEAILRPLVQASAKWLGLGLPVEKIKIVEISPEKIARMLPVFLEEKQKMEGNIRSVRHHFKYDLFISYSRKNQLEANWLEEELLRQAPDLRIFLDRKELSTGMSWQQELYEALDNCRMVVAMLSEPYISSKVCKEEFNIAVFRHREANEAILFPIFLYSAHLPTYMKLIQFTDCREYDQAKLSAACASIIQQIHS